MATRYSLFQDEQDTVQEVEKIPSGQEEDGDRSGCTMPNWLVEEMEKRAEKRAKEKEAKEKDAKLSTARNHTLSCTGVLYTGRLRAKLPPSALLPMPDNLAEMEEEEMPRWAEGKPSIVPLRVFSACL